MCSEDLILSWGNQVGIYIDDISDIWTVLGKITCKYISFVRFPPVAEVSLGVIHRIILDYTNNPDPNAIAAALIFQITIIDQGPNLQLILLYYKHIILFVLLVGQRFFSGSDRTATPPHIQV